MYLVYKITNTINNKIYIGITHHTLQRRWREHCNSTNAGQDMYIFHKAIQKYGKDVFTQEILACDLTKDEACVLERQFIQEYNSYYLNGCGYNMTFGGECNDHLKGELNYGATLSNQQAQYVCELLMNPTYTFNDILRDIGLSISESHWNLISRINAGISYHNDIYEYPIRKDARHYNSINRIGDKNPAAKLNETSIQQIITLLTTTSLTQIEIGKMFNVSYNTINLINRCQIWTQYHNYKNNIRKESQI